MRRENCVYKQREEKSLEDYINKTIKIIPEFYSSTRGEKRSWQKENLTYLEQGKKILLQMVNSFEEVDAFFRPLKLRELTTEEWLGNIMNLYHYKKY